MFSESNGYELERRVYNASRLANASDLYLLRLAAGSIGGVLTNIDSESGTRLNPVRTLQDGGHQAPRGSSAQRGARGRPRDACAAGQRRLGDQPQPNIYERSAAVRTFCLVPQCV